MDTPNPAQIAPQLLRSWLDREGRKVGWLARRLHVHQSTVSHWLKNRAVPQMVHRVQLENITDGFVLASSWRDD